MSGFDFRGILRPGDVVAWPQGPGEPTGLSGTLVAQRHDLLPFALLLLGLGATRTVRREHADRITLRTGTAPAITEAGPMLGTSSPGIDLTDAKPVALRRAARRRGAAARPARGDTGLLHHRRDQRLHPGTGRSGPRRGGRRTGRALAADGGTTRST